jgi:hypothetical protein
MGLKYTITSICGYTEFADQRALIINDCSRLELSRIVYQHGSDLDGGHAKVKRTYRSNRHLPVRIRMAFIYTNIKEIRNCGPQFYYKPYQVTQVVPRHMARTYSALTSVLGVSLLCSLFA